MKENRKAVRVRAEYHAALHAAKRGDGRYRGRSVESLLDELLEFALRAKKIPVRGSAS